MSSLQRKIEIHTQRIAALTATLLRSRYGLWALGIISFVESSLVIPIITDPFLVIYLLANRRALWAAIIVTTLASVLGGFVAYVLAASFFEFISAHYLFGSHGDTFHHIAQGFQNNTFVLTLFGAITPIPYTIVALVIGFVEGSILLFILASIIGRGGRYTLVGTLTARFGEQALLLAQKRIATVTVVCVLLAALYVALRLL